MSVPTPTIPNATAKLVNARMPPVALGDQGRPDRGVGVKEVGDFSGDHARGGFVGLQNRIRRVYEVSRSGSVS